VKSPVASLCFTCSSFSHRVRVMMSVLIFSWPAGPAPFELPLIVAGLYWPSETLLQLLLTLGRRVGVWRARKSVLWSSVLATIKMISEG